jgi:hypothetical protein
MKLIDKKWTLGNLLNKKVKILKFFLTIVGIVSFGDSSCSGSGVYTNVGYYLNWIADNF